MIVIASLDHLVLAVGSIECTTAFHARVLGIKAARFMGAVCPLTSVRFHDPDENLIEVSHPDRGTR
jgi:catechol 2,3-dioxygenase-like lactoylglutathione lyase family enzyme